MRVLYVTPNAAAGGMSRSLAFLIGSFPKETVRPFVICPDGPKVADFVRSGAEVIVVPGLSLIQAIEGTMRGYRWLTLARAAWYLQYGGLLRRIIRRVNPDIVHLNERGLLHMAVIARRAGIPVVMHARSMAQRRPLWLRGMSEYCVEHFVDHVIAIDESVRRSILEFRQCTTIYNPLPPDNGQLDGRTRPENRIALRVSFLSGLSDYKGVWDLLEAARRLSFRKDIVFQIYGANTRPDNFYSTVFGSLCSLLGLTSNVARELRLRIEATGLQETVHQLGPVESDCSVMRSTDVLIFPSRLNAVGRSVFEAGVYGIPSIVALRNRVEDIVEDGRTGIIVPEADPEALAAAIVRLADNPDLCRAMGENARRKYLDQFNAQRVAGQVLSVYQSILGHE